jgi:hypothetical protein
VNKTDRSCMRNIRILHNSGKAAVKWEHRKHGHRWVIINKSKKPSALRCEVGSAGSEQGLVVGSCKLTKGKEFLD